MTAAMTRPLGPQNGGWHGPMEELLSDFVSGPKKVVNTLTNNRESLPSFFWVAAG